MTWKGKHRGIHIYTCTCFNKARWETCVILYSLLQRFFCSRECQKKQKQPPSDALQNRCSLKFRNIWRKIPALEFLFNKVADLQACNFTKNEICKILKNTFFIEHLRRLPPKKEVVLYLKIFGIVFLLFWQTWKFIKRLFSF